MQKNRTILLLLLFTCCLTLTGCKDPEKEQALQEVEELRIELSDIEDSLAKTKKEKKSLKSQTDELAETLETTEQQLNEKNDSYDTLKQNFAKIEKENDSLKNKIENLQQELESDIQEQQTNELLGLVLTTHIDKEGLPLDDFDSFFMEKKHFYIFSKWNLTKKEHTVTVKLYDGTGKLRKQIPRTFTPKTPTRNARCLYTINKALDKPGKWKVEIYLDGHKMGEKNFILMSEY
ncbi:MAG: hypothetical protein FVQ80_03715 [Planctomycetes bacterium]|nr:hypothetical protein [Planctomycetota bacterium]